MPIGERLAEIIGDEVIFPESCVDDASHKLSRGMRDGQIMLLENLRFHEGETANDEKFAEGLSRLADIYVSEAFGACHRAHASVDALARSFRDRGAGFLVVRELEMLQRLIDKPEKPFLIAMGGAKVKDKLPLIRNLLPRIDTLILGGALSYTFLKALGHPVGRSRVEEGCISKASDILARAKDLGVKVMLPNDHVVVDELKEDASYQVVSKASHPDHSMAVDIGPKTREEFREAILQARTIFWNGPMGVYEHPLFAEGSNAVARAVADATAFTVVGGGDSAAAIRKSGLAPFIDHISTGGGASLEFLEGKKLPGVEAIHLD